MPPEQVASAMLNTRRVPKPGRYDCVQQKPLARDSVRGFSNALEVTDGVEGFMSDRPCSKWTYADGKFIGGFAGGPSSC